MTSVAKRIACVACLDPARSVHTPTFLRAVALAEEFLFAADQVQLELHDDSASAEGSAVAAHKVLLQPPAAVVGHFASASAAVAAPLYAQYGLPLYLPAATRRTLTRHASTFRLCDHDEDYSAWLCEAAARQQWQLSNIEHDASVHGSAVARSITQMRADWPVLAGQPSQVFAGMYGASVQFVSDRLTAMAPAQRLILTDDAWASQLPQDLLAQGVDLVKHSLYVVGIQAQPQGPQVESIRQAWQGRWGGEPGCYFWETLAALQVANARAEYGHMPNGAAIETVIGPVTFDREGEHRPHNFGLWRVTPTGLQRVEPAEVAE